MAPPLTLMGTDGLWMVDGPPELGDGAKVQCEDGSNVRVLAFSDDGAYLAWCNGVTTQVIFTSDYRNVLKLDKPKVQCLKFSPKGTVIAIWETYSVNRDTNQGIPNLSFYDLKTGQLLRSLVQKKQKGWDPNWTKDEGLCCRNVNNELHFFENNNFGEIKTKLLMQKISEYSLAVSGPPYMVAGYVPGSKGQPSFVRVYKYPNFGGPSAAVVSKSFFKADTVTMEWNSTGTALLVLSSTEISEQSYYGDQGLHFLSAARGESCLVERAKNGPVYHIAWHPKGTEFCVVYGFMPAKATLYNLKAEPLFDFGTGPRNCCHYNPQGTILCLAGFGNIRGNLELFDARQKKLISQLQAPDSTVFEWHPDGEHILTATTSPRLRVGNGYRIWHFTGTLLKQTCFEQKKELRAALWHPVPEGTFPERPLNYRAAQAMASQVKPQEEKAPAYRPPAARGTAPPAKVSVYEAPSDPNKKAQDSSGAQSESKAAKKNQKKREAKKAKQAAQTETQSTASSDMAADSLFSSAPSTSSAGAFVSTGDPEKDKRIRNLRKKLQQIEKLKEQQAAGKEMEKNQLDKMRTEHVLLKELSELQISGEEDWR